VDHAGGPAACLSVQAADADALVAAAVAQLDDGADLVKVYLDGTPDPAVAPWSAGEVRRVVEAVHARGARVTAHAGYAGGARVGAEAGVDAIEAEVEVDDETAAIMARRGVGSCPRCP
jgi:imidazolonepropionase-like amidohydrolase